MTNNNSTYNWENLTKEEILSRYTEELEQFKIYGNQLNITDHEIHNLFEECFKNLRRNIVNQSNLRKNINFIIKLLKYMFVILSVCFLLYFIIIQHNPTTSFILRNVQNFIYPGLKIWRKISVPIIKIFPALTELYDESCLLHNPFFQVQDMECSPCEQTYGIPDLSAIPFKNIEQFGMPYVIKTDQETITISKLKDFYNKNKNTFIEHAPRIIYSTNSTIKTIDILMDSIENVNTSSEEHYIWRINRMSAGRVLREIFPRPRVIPQLGQSTERFILMWGSKASISQLPDTECSNVFIVQASGQRSFILQPSPECKTHCKPVSVLLKSRYVLVFSWWYYRAISLPDDFSVKPSVSFMSSYC